MLYLIIGAIIYTQGYWVILSVYEEGHFSSACCLDTMHASGVSRYSVENIPGEALSHSRIRGGNYFLHMIVARLE